MVGPSLFDPIHGFIYFCFSIVFQYTEVTRNKASENDPSKKKSENDCMLFVNIS